MCIQNQSSDNIALAEINQYIQPRKWAILGCLEHCSVEKVYDDIDNSAWVLNELSKSEYIVKPIHYNILVKINPWP